MIKIKILLILIVFISEIQADEISSKQLKEMFKKSCSQSIDNGISINSTNINNCNLKYINEFPKSKELEIAQLKKEIAQQKSMVQRLEKKSASIHKNYQKTNLLKDELIQIRDESKQESNKLKTLKFQLNQLDKKHLYFQKIIQNFKNEQKKLTKTDKIFMDNLNQKYKITLKEIETIKSTVNRQTKKIETNKNTLFIYGETLSEQEKKIEKVENETSQLKILFSKYIFNINNDFIGTYGQIGTDNHYMLGLEYEGYNKRKNSSIFVNLSYEELNKELSYSTLYGLDNISIDNAKTIYGMEIGYKKFRYNIYNNWRWYYAFSLGLAKVKNDSSTTTGKLSLGMEYTHKTSKTKSDKIYIEGGYRYLNNVNISTSKFNSFGVGKDNQDKKSLGMGYISIKYLWRL